MNETPHELAVTDRSLIDRGLRLMQQGWRRTREMQPTDGLQYSGKHSVAGPQPDGVLRHPGKGRSRWSLNFLPRKQHFHRLQYSGAENRMRRLLYRSLQRLGHDELKPLLLVVLSAGGLWFFAVLANHIKEDAPPAFDRAVLLAMRTGSDPSDPLGPLWFEEMMRDVTAFGGMTWLALLSLGTIGYLAMRRQIGMLWFVAVAVTGSWILSISLKRLFDRPRPELVPHGAYFSTASFPSGHSLMAAATYLTLAAILCRVQSQRRLKAYLLFWALLLTLLTGVSRVYLGVHWPTDVLAGWTLGAIWAVLCWLIAHGLQRRGHLPKPS